MKRLLKMPSPFKGLSLLLAAALLAAVVLPAGYAALTPSPALAAANAPTAAKWYDGLIQYSTITNCVSIIQGLPYTENGMGTYVGFIADTNAAQPSPNVPYYIHVVVAGLGNACSGMRAYIDIGLPAATSPAISGANPVYCLYDGVALPPAECPQSLTASSYNPGMYNMRSTDSAHAYLWPIPQGHILEIQIPVQSSATLTNSQLVGRVWALDGNSSPWLQPTQGVYVFSSTPTFLYPNPATINITTTTARSQAQLFTHGIGGTGYFDLGTIPGNYNLVNHESIAIPSGGNEYVAYDDWTPAPSGHLQPDTVYYWRFTYVPTSGSPVVGGEQSFRTLPDGRVTIGSGTTASCTSAAFTSALAAATTKEILFNRGSLPTTITFSGAQSITSTVSINGGNKVILSTGGSSNHFNVLAGAHLTLSQIELDNGSGSCGGAVHVLGNGLLTLNTVRLNSNTATQGGAVCIDANGQAVIDASLFTSNHANLGGGVINNGTLTVTHSAFVTNSATSFGGGIENYGTATVSDTNFTQNTAGTNGGGIDTTVNLTLIRAVFSGNQAGFRGGGVYNYLGTMNISASQFLKNHAGAYGGGIGIDGGTATLQTSELSGNSAVSVGGGVSNSGSLGITNTTLADNHAPGNGSTIAGNGGGIENTGTGTLVLLNVTLASNTSGGTGGNIHLGATASSATILQNTLVASGSPNNCDKAVTSQGNNLESANSCGLTFGGDKVNTNPHLGWLLYNRGLTRTLALYPGSLAIDAGNNSACPAVDQRGFTRPLDGDKNGSAVCDIGAFEYNPSLDFARFFLPQLRR